MANDIIRALQYLNNADISTKQPALYQTIKTLIDELKKTQAELAAIVSPASVSPGGVVTGFAPVGATYLTSTVQSYILPYSSILAAGTNVTLDSSVANVLTVNVATGAGDLQPFLLMGA